MALRCRGIFDVTRRERRAVAVDEGKVGCKDRDGTSGPPSTCLATRS